MLNSEFWILNVECWMLNSECWMLDVECRILNAGCWMLNVECWILNAGCWMLNVECWMQIKKYFLNICMYSTGVHFPSMCLFDNVVNSVDRVVYSFECLCKTQSLTQLCQGQLRVRVHITTRLPSVKLIPQQMTSTRCLVQMSAGTWAVQTEISFI